MRQLEDELAVRICQFRHYLVGQNITDYSLVQNLILPIEVWLRVVLPQLFPMLPSLLEGLFKDLADQLQVVIRGSGGLEHKQTLTILLRPLGWDIAEHNISMADRYLFPQGMGQKATGLVMALSGVSWHRFSRYEEHNV